MDKEMIIKGCEYWVNNHKDENIQALLAEFLESLASITDEELFKALEKARDDSKNSYLLDGEDEILGTITDNAERSQVINRKAVK